MVEDRDFVYSADCVGNALEVYTAVTYERGRMYRFTSVSISVTDATVIEQITWTYVNNKGCALWLHKNQSHASYAANTGTSSGSVHARLHL